ncbi:hypothetical protein AAG906_014268 [Vitis piasezkii]
MEVNSEKGDRRRRVGLVYDDCMCTHNPDRIRAIWKKLESAGILQRCVVFNAKEVEDKHILSVHNNHHVNLIKNISSKQFDSRRNRIASKFNSIYMNEGSLEAAYLAAGSVIEVAEMVAKGDLSSAFAIVRPPGHHAEQDEPMGFCLYNNVAIATSFLLNERSGLGIKKILIVDWDVHHGNGTQKMFWKDPRVLFFSVHRGCNPRAHDVYKQCTKTLTNTKAKLINPHIIYKLQKDILWEPNAGYFYFGSLSILYFKLSQYNAAIGDPLRGCRVTPYGYSVMLKKLMEFAEGKIIMALEGGYNLVSLANSVLACVEVLLEDKPIAGSSEAYPFKSTWCVIQAVRQELSAFWPTLADELPKKLTKNLIKKKVMEELLQQKQYINTNNNLYKTTLNIYHKWTCMEKRCSVQWIETHQKRLYGRLSSSVAFLNPEENKQDRAYICLYIITLEQLNDVLLQENASSYDISSPLLDLVALTLLLTNRKDIDIHVKLSIQASRQYFNSSMYPYKLCKFSHIISLRRKLKKDNWKLHYIHNSRYMVPHQLEFLLTYIVPTSASLGTTPKCVTLRKH